MSRTQKNNNKVPMLLFFFYSSGINENCYYNYISSCFVYFISSPVSTLKYICLDDNYNTN